MPNDITTLAIEIQSQEAERNLRTFNELLSLGSQTAQKMEKISIEMDASSAVAQLQALRNGYANLAASLNDLHLDVAMPEMPAVSAPGGPAVDTSALEELKAFFASTAEMTRTLREEMTQFNESLRELEANSTKTATAGGARTSSMSHGITVSREYAAALKELSAAQREMEKAAAQADAAMKATVAADEDAAAVKKRLRDAQKELAKVSRQLAETHRTMSGDIIGLSVKEEELKNKVAELKSVYEEAKAAAEKFNRKLEDAGEKADAARAKYQELKAQLDAMPKTSPMQGAASGVGDFSAKIRLAGRDVTKLMRGISGIASMAGGAIPGVAGLGRAISMLGMGNPYLIAAAVAIAAITAAVKAYNDMKKTELEGSREGVELAKEQSERTQKLCNELEEYEARLTRLRSLNEQNNATRQLENDLVRKLQEGYKKLGLIYDGTATKGKRMTEAQLKQIIALEEAKKRQLRDTLARQQKGSNKDAEHIWDELASAGSVGYSIGWRAAAMKATGPSGMAAAAEYEANGMKLYAEVRGKVSEAVKKLQSTEDTDERQKIIDDLQKYIADFKRDHGHFADIFDLDDVTKAVKGYKDGLKSIQETEKASREANDRIGGRSKKEIEASVARLQAQRDASKAMLREFSKTPEQKNRENLREIAKLQAELRGLSGKNGLDLTIHNGQITTVLEAQAKIQDEINKRTLTRLQYEKQITQQKERQEERERREAIALQEKIANLKKSYTFYTDGKVEKKDSTARDADRKMEMTRYEDLSKSVNERTRTEAQYRLMGLQIEQLNADEQNNRARKQWEKGRSGFVYDKKGNIIVREKSDAELAADRKKEIAAAEAKVKGKSAYTRGSTEWYGAMAEVDRLRQEDFKKRQETSFANLGFSQIQAHNNMTQAVEARSSQALRLETRNFSKPDNAWKTLEKKQTQIYETLSGFGPDISAIAEANRSISDKLVQV